MKPSQELIEEAKKMKAEGISLNKIAAYLGLMGASAAKYWVDPEYRAKMLERAKEKRKSRKEQRIKNVTNNEINNDRNILDQAD